MATTIYAWKKIIPSKGDVSAYNLVSVEYYLESGIRKYLTSKVKITTSFKGVKTGKATVIKSDTLKNALNVARKMKVGTGWRTY